MTLVNINLKNVGSGTNPVDKVIFYSPVYRDGTTSSEMVSTAEQAVSLVNGVGSINLAPGPVRVRFSVKGIADTVAKEGIVPNSGTVSLNKVIEGSFTYTPPITSDAVETIRTELAEALKEISDSKNPSVEIPSGTDWNTLISQPMYHRKYASTTDVNAPVEGTGVLVVGITQNPSGMQTHTFYASSGGGIYNRSRGSNGNWTAWVRVDKDVRIDREDILLAPSARRATVVDGGLRRRGRVIGTGGKPAVALRFDHHLVPFGTKVLPVLKRLRLPWGQMLMPSTVGTGNDNWSWSRIAQECHDSGGEVWNHSYSHSDVLNTGQADREVSLSLTRLKENLPSLWIDAWAPPGQPSMMGYEGQDTPEKHWNTYPGRLILSQHALVRGYYPAVYRKLNGAELVGTGHVTIDKMDSNAVGAMVRGAMSTGSGITLMLHSTYLDSAGYISTAQLTSALEYIAQLRDQGEIVVLSPAGIMLADQSEPRTTGNITTAGTAGQVTGSWSETIWSREADQHYGVPHEAEVWVSGSGTVSLTVEVTSATRPVTQTHSVTLVAGVPRRLSAVVTPPMDTTATKVTLTGSVSHTGIRYRPI